MGALASLLDATGPAPALSGAEAEAAAADLAAASGLAIYPRSIAAGGGLARRGGRVYFVGRRKLARHMCGGAEKLLGVLSRDGAPEFFGEPLPSAHGPAVGGIPLGDPSSGTLACAFKLCERDRANARALAAALPWLNPQCLGPGCSVGLGDRLGLATPGHVRAVRGTGVKPVFAQQSVREMTRTRRTPQQVVDDALWGAFEEGFRDGFGADADHLKSAADLDAALAAGFRMFTIDLSEHVDNAAGHESAPALRAKLRDVPWAELETTEADCRRAFLGRPHRVDREMELAFSEEDLLRAVVKYGRAVARTVLLYRRLAAACPREASGGAGRGFELEMSVDETDSPTTPHEHFYIASELKRLGAPPASLAPRFIGEFEKGIDYKGDLAAFEAAFSQHIRIARALGPYKISIHSGSDKFSIYPIAARCAGGLVHLKTAGTSYLEALRTVALADPALFREIFAFAIGRYEEDKASYSVSADLSRLPAPDKIPDDRLAALLDDNDACQTLHVTFGSVLTATDAAGADRFRSRLLRTLAENEELHFETVARHLRRHIEPFA